MAFPASTLLVQAMHEALRTHVAGRRPVAMGPPGPQPNAAGAALDLLRDLDRWLSLRCRPPRRWLSQARVVLSSIELVVDDLEGKVPWTFPPSGSPSSRRWR